MNIDFVIPWVDGDDAQWVAQRNLYAGTGEDRDPSRFRDWDILRYWFRAVEEHAPWVHLIFFVTCGQIPQWLNRDHPKLKLIHHQDYIPAKYLPTFSSHTIELNFHRIPELSEHFVYFNDDMFLNANVSPEDFFLMGKSRDCAVLDFPAPGTDAYDCAQRNVVAFLNGQFDFHKVLWQNPGKWFSPLNGKYIIKNLLLSFSSDFPGIRNFHIPASMRKSTFETIWDMAPELLDRTCRNRFRSTADVNQYIMTYYPLCKGNFVPRSPRFGKCYRLELDEQKMEQDILYSRHKVICLNDHPNIGDFPAAKARLISLLEQRYPKKSSFEL